MNGKYKELLAITACALGAAYFLLRPSPAGVRAQSPQPVVLPGLSAPVRVVSDINGIPHIFAQTDKDAATALGYIHAKDRFFQMDSERRQFSGTSAEIFGQPALAGDIQLRTLGLRRAAQASLNGYSAGIRAVLDGYAAGVNAWLHGPEFILPPEYSALELTAASIADWTAEDSLTVGKGLAFGLAFDLSDIDYTQALGAYMATGGAAGFDGNALFFQDLFRSAPFEPVLSIQNFFASPMSTNRRRASRGWNIDIPPPMLRLARKYAQTAESIPLLKTALHRRSGEVGSNWFVVSGRYTASGAPMLASDPHLSLSTPSVFYEAHLSVANDPAAGSMNVNGVSFPGVPGVILGCNDQACWGATVFPMDVTDVYQEQLALGPGGVPIGTTFEGHIEPLEFIEQIFKVNQVGNGTADDIVTANVGLLDGGVSLLVPRRMHGPIVSVDMSNPAAPTALSVQFTGFGPTMELAAFWGFQRARTPDDFKTSLQNFDVGSQNFSFADSSGNIAYFTGGELPLREDLQTMGAADGNPPFLVRDGTHTHKNEWLAQTTTQPGQATPFEILPFAEMPQVVNPPQGYIVSSNQDPVGVTFDNNPLGRMRAGGGVYYLSAGFADGNRAARVNGLIQDMIAKGRKFDLGIMAGIQASNMLRDAQVMTPWILQAWIDASAYDAPPQLAALANDREINEAVARLSVWNYTTPTGIREGYDPADDPDNLPAPSDANAQDSIAATLYSVWRGQFIAATVDAGLAAVNAGPVTPIPMTAVRNLLDQWPSQRGKGASGINFFSVQGVTDPETARDIIILKSMRSALDLLAGDEFAPAFNRSTVQDDYRWGKLHRIVFSHPLGGPFNIPPAGGFMTLGPTLPGISRPGGFESVDAATHDPRAKTLDGFMFSHGPSRRLVGELLPGGTHAREIIPGGESGVLGHPHYSSMLGRWLVNAFHDVLLTQSDVDSNSAGEVTYNPQ